jgi:ATP-binding cassette subfamily F protein 3
VAFDYAGQPLLQGVSFGVEPGDRWGVIGRNGSGKTTLFRLLVAQLQPTRGSISRESALRVALLDQHRDFGEARTVWDAAATPFAHLALLEQSLETQAHALAQDSSPQALARYDDDLHRFDREGGHTFRATVDALLEGLGFDAERARTQSLGGLSGGERGRLGLVRQLAQPADLRLLDEPTNHLDLETTRWLEEYLLSSRTAFMAISHDRAFLARVADHILHLEAGTAFAYDTGYVHFVELRTERREAQQRAYDQQQRRVAAEEDYIRRNIAGQNSRQAKGRRKRLSRLPRLSPPPGEDGGAMAVRLESSARGGDQVLVLRDVRLEIDGVTLLDAFSARITRGEIVGIVGPNGAGKSTLLHAITGERAAAGGQITIGAGITFAHYRQDLAQVPADRTLFQVIHDLRPRWERGPVQSHLGRFGFSGDEVHRIAGSLSGGEQARLALAMIVLSGANLLLFDEPTNHLDVESIEALEDALDAFDGTILLVSHDRALLESLTTRTWALYNTRMEDHAGPFEEWERAHERQKKARREESARASQEQRTADKAAARRQQAHRQQRSADQRARQRAVAEAETRAHAIEAKVAELTRLLHDPALYQSADGVAEAARLRGELRTAQSELDLALQAWADAEQDSAMP